MSVRNRVLAIAPAVAALLCLVVSACGGTAAASGQPTYKVGTCLTVPTPSGAMHKVSCTNPPNNFDVVMSVVNGNGTCSGNASRTQYEPAQKVTYCLQDEFNSRAPTGGSPTPTTSPTSGDVDFALPACSTAWPALKQMNATVAKGTTDQFGNLVFAAGVWPGSATIASWNAVLTALNSAAQSAGLSQLSSQTSQLLLPAGYIPTSDSGQAALHLGTATYNIAQICAPGGRSVSNLGPYVTSDGFSWQIPA